MAAQRTYDDACGIARALDVVGERWALLAIRELLLGPKRFTDLRTGLPGVSANILSQRLRELEASGVVLRRRLEPPAGSWVYELTDRGRGLEHVILDLGRWGVESTPTVDAPIGVDSVILSLQALFDPKTAGDFRAHYEVRLGGYRFTVVVADGRIDVARGAAEHADAVIETTPRRLDALVSGELSVTELVQSGEVTVEGDLAAVERFATLFSAS
ncbi:winged helix-turn-helix transcriptional regulator [Agromyces subbeticus]|uniref:winged helix-turn-helix transcriptional regulator n=1 Tax=Agromyces subbeticus TaxID=293890 RepID=UPI0003B30BC7|nr:winged helix-turn-helix transcriptional regulator [Agromyces subbeticus]